MALLYRAGKLPDPVPGVFETNRRGVPTRFAVPQVLFMGKIAQAIARTVSYTHLDVYKRQAQASKVAAGNAAASASTSAADAAHDARSANDAKTAVEGIVSDFTHSL